MALNCRVSFTPARVQHEHLSVCAGLSLFSLLVQDSAGAGELFIAASK